LLYSEAGLGDTLQFCRYAALNSAQGAIVFLEVQPPLLSLLANLEGVSQVLAAGSPLPSFDYQCPLMSLPLAFKTTLDTIPAAAKYLHGDESKVAGMKCLPESPRICKGSFKSADPSGCAVLVTTTGVGCSPRVPPSEANSWRRLKSPCDAHHERVWIAERRADPFIFTPKRKVLKLPLHTGAVGKPRVLLIEPAHTHTRRRCGR
jgi:hypothetical protein